MRWYSGMEMIQALLYQTGKEKKETTEQEGKERPREENPPVQMEETLWEEQEAEAAENFFVEAEEEKDEGRWKNIVEAVQRHLHNFLNFFCSF